MNRSITPLHPWDPNYNPVLDGAGRGLEDLFPPIDNPPCEEDTAKGETPVLDEGGERIEAP